MLQAGQQIGEFRVERLLGEGGMGAVYVATQLSTGRQRALKAMHARFANVAAYVERFVAEARVASHIESEHVVEVVAAGVDRESQTPWLAMELLEGQSLDEMIASRGPLPFSEAVELVAQICHGLGAAHAAGIIHRDLKPENIFIAKSRRRGVSFVVKILDFGIAKWTQEAMTAAGSQAIGTPFWMAPEQTELSGRIGPKTDIWALGLIVFYVVTGRAYWWSAQPSATSTLPQFLHEALVQPLDPASVRAQAMGAGVALPPAFDDWFAGCVNRDASARFDSIEACLNALTAALSPRTATTAPVGTMVMSQAVLPPPQAWVGQPAYGSDPNVGYGSAPGSGPIAHGHGSYPGHAPAPHAYTPAPGLPPGGAYAPPPYSFEPPPKRGLLALAIAGVLLLLMATGGAIGAFIVLRDDDERPARAASSEATVSAPAQLAPIVDPYPAALAACQSALAAQDPDAASQRAAEALTVRPGDAAATSCRDGATALRSERTTFDQGVAALGRGDHAAAYTTFDRLPTESTFRSRPEVGRAAQSVADGRLGEARGLLPRDAGQAFLIARSVGRMHGITPAQSSTARGIEAQAQERGGTIYEARVVSARLVTAETCSVTVSSARTGSYNCRIRVRCDNRYIYGGGTSGYATCQREDGRFALAHDRWVTREDQDPSMRFSLAERSLRVTDPGLGLDENFELVDPR